MNSALIEHILIMALISNMSGRRANSIAHEVIATHGVDTWVQILASMHLAGMSLPRGPSYTRVGDGCVFSFDL